MKTNGLKLLIFTAFLFTSVQTVWASQEFNRAMYYLKRGDYGQASQRFLDIQMNPSYKSEHPKALYYLGESLAKMGLNQSAIYYLTAIPKLNRGQVNKALEALYELSFSIGDQEALNYALSKIELKRFPKKKRDLLYYRLGEVYLNKGAFKKALGAFRKIPSYSKLYARAQYSRGLAFAQLGNARASIRSYTKAANARRTKGITDVQRVGSLMGRARAYYQLKAWDASIKAYRMIPRDSYFWHDALFESSWAMLRSGKFRSAMSNFQSLHSEFYDDRYQPESLILRAIVYLYICRYDEVSKVLTTYNKNYGKLFSQVNSYLRDTGAEGESLHQMKQMLKDTEAGKGLEDTYNGAPGVALKHISKQAFFSRNFDYLKNLYKEKLELQKTTRAWRASNLGRQIDRNLNSKIAKVERHLSRHIQSSMKDIAKELTQLNDQKEFIKYEVTNAQTEAARKQMVGNETQEAEVDQNASRDYYVKNGYEYWPFQGEYWLDEIGNYHYVGTSQCQ